jgi:hypothetical protein
VLKTTDAAALLLVQVPPGDMSDNIIEDPTQTSSRPKIAAGNGLTVIVVEVLQPVGRE